jgi:hypothetical protein
MGVCKC